MGDNCEKERLLGETCSCDVVDSNCKPCQSHHGDECKQSNGKPDRQSNPESDCMKTKSRTKNICKGANHLQKKVVSEQTRMILQVSGIVILAVVVISAVVVYVLSLNHLNFHQKILQKTLSRVQKRNALCKEITKENVTLFLRGEIDATTQKALKYINPKKNIFYAIDQPLTREQACGLESVLRLLPDKLVYIIEFDTDSGEKNCNGLDYVTYLQKLYINLNRIKTSKTHYFEGTLLDGCWDKVDDSLASFGARILAVWQFGGAALSDNLLMNSRQIFERANKSCSADRDLVSCPRECSVFCYRLMKDIKDRMKKHPVSSNSTDFGKLIDSSIKVICPEDGSKSTCDYVTKIQESEMCEGNSSSMCQFIRLDKLKKLNQSKTIMKEFCHYIGQSN